MNIDDNVNDYILGNLEPKKVFYFFEEISKIPRCSGNTKAISDYLKNFAIERNLDFYQDELNNIIIYKYDKLNKYSNLPKSEDIIILQGHTDMVCDIDPDSSKNMELEGLDLEVNNDCISAKGTTLGGDDGVAIAMILAILDDDSLEVPPIEALFTSDEEIGLIGAKGLDYSKLNGKQLINLDSEDEGFLVASCAGGNRLDIEIPLEYDDFNAEFKDLNEGCQLITISITGLKGGHSGVEIDKGLANANKLLGRLLEILNSNLNIRLIDIRGGNLDNAIPTESKITILANSEEVKGIVKTFENKINEEFNDVEDNIFLDILATDLSEINDFLSEKFNKSENKLISADSTNKIVEFINTVPNGVCKWSEDIKGLVETSLNLGILELIDSESIFKATFSVRSSKEDEKKKLNDEVRLITDNLGGKLKIRDDYPGWEYKKESKLRNLVCDEYEKAYGESMGVHIIHAGLECGVFADNIEDFDAVSIGPNLYDVHSYNEKMSISSVFRTYNLLLNVLKELK